MHNRTLVDKPKADTPGLLRPFDVGIPNTRFFLERLKLMLERDDS